MRRLKDLSFKNKFLFSTLAVMVLLSVGIALATRWVLLKNLTSELEQRGIAIAQSLAEMSRTYILTNDKPNLVSLVFDAAQLGERKPLISYIFTVDTQQELLAHTFTDTFPDELLHANIITPEQNHSVKLVRVKNSSAYDIAVPVREGIYQIGTIHLGLNKRHIDHLIGKLRITFLGIMAVIVVIFILIITWLSKYISRPISQLTRMADEISRGNLDIKLDFGSKIRCWEIADCQERHCPAYHNTDLPCWFVDKTMGAVNPSFNLPEKLMSCEECVVYANREGDEVVQLADSFKNMVSSIKLYRTRLHESEEKYRSLFDSGPDPIFVLDKETLEILDANPSAEHTYGYSKEELIRKPFTDLVPESKEAVLLHFKENSSWSSYGIYQRARPYKKGNIPFHVNVHARPAIYKEREVIIVATNDITAMIEKDAQLIQASKMTAFGEMSAGIAHELNQPLNAIKMGSEFLKMMIERGESIPHEQLYQVVKEGSEQVDRASEIINCLREFGRKADFIEEKVDINKPIRGVLAILGQQLNLQSIEVRLDLDEALPRILAHSNRLQQVIFNLVTNARDAINHKSEEANGRAGPRVIAIRSFMENDRVAVTVADTGTGIAESVKDKIFQPFFTTKETGQGMGLGLSITYGIVKEHGGEIHIQSEQGVGTIFRLTFPVHIDTRERQHS